MGRMFSTTLWAKCEKLWLLKVSRVVSSNIHWTNIYGKLALVQRRQGTPLQYSCLENPMDGGAWWATDQGVARSQTWLTDFTFTFHFHALEKELTTHSSVLAWRIPGRAEPGGLLSMGSHRVRHDWSDLAAAAAIVRHCAIYLDHRNKHNRHSLCSTECVPQSIVTETHLW